MRRSILACGLLLAFAGMATAAAAAAASRNSESSPSHRPSTTHDGRHDQSPEGALALGIADGSRLAAPYPPFPRGHAALADGDARPPAGERRALARPPARSPRARCGSCSTALAAPSPTRTWWHAKHPPGLGGWLCIHRYEGSWADSGSPYWGGLQMDLSFQQTYGGWLLRHKGTADHWSPLEQIWVAVRASHSRGFSPWPSTARDCGLY